MPPADPFPRLRALCLALDGATEKIAWGEPTFRAPGGKLFAMYASPETHHGNGRPAAWIKAMPDNQRLLIEHNPDRFFSPPYMGPFGWVAVWLDRRPPWSEVQALLEDGYRQVVKQPRVRATDRTAPEAQTRARKTSGKEASTKKPVAKKAVPEKRAARRSR